MSNIHDGTCYELLKKCPDDRLYEINLEDGSH